MTTSRTYKLKLGRVSDIFDQSPILPVIKDVNVRFRHAYVVGVPGTGKSNTLTLMAHYDALEYGMAAIVIDPKGQITRDLHYLAPDKSRVIYLSIDHPFVINPLRKKGYLELNLIQEFVNALRIIIKHTVDNPIHVTALMEILVKEAIPILREEDKDASFLFKFFFNSEFRTNYFKKHKNKSEFWAQFDGESGKSNRESLQNIATRLHAFQNDPRIVRMVSGENQFNVREFAEQKKILLVDTSMMSKETRIYISSLVIGAIDSYVNFEMKAWKSEVYPISIFCDEFDTYITDTFPQLMEFARGYRVGFNLSHVNFGQVNRHLMDRILSTANTFIGFRTSDTEAKKLASIYGLSPREFQDLPDYSAILRIKNENVKFDALEFPHKIPKDYEVPPASAPAPEEVNFLRPGSFPV